MIPPDNNSPANRQKPLKTHDPLWHVFADSCRGGVLRHVSGTNCRRRRDRRFEDLRARRPIWATVHFSTRSNWPARRQTPPHATVHPTAKAYLQTGNSKSSIHTMKKKINPPRIKILWRDGLILAICSTSSIRCSIYRHLINLSHADRR